MTHPHPRLAQLLIDVAATASEVPSNEDWQRLIGLISRAYYDHDREFSTLHTSIEISQREMHEVYADLKRRSDNQLQVERHRVEESIAMLSASLQATDEAMIVVDMNRRVVAWNRSYVKMIGIPDELMTTRDHGRIVEFASRLYADPHAAIANINAIHQTRDISNDEVRYTDGRILHRYSAPITLPNGDTVARVTYYRDVTAEREATASILRARETAEAASHAKTMFMANMSHELRTPLNAVIGLADLLLLEGGDPLTKRQNQYLEGIVQSGRHLLAMVNDVLDLAKIEAGRQDLELEPICTDDAISEAVALLQALASGRGVTLAAELPEEIPQIQADPIRLRQILYNLISNAVKFTDRDGHVKVSAAQENGAVLISVSDTGIGIAPQDMGRLFRAFEQLNLPSGNRPGGTGLGLALTKRLVEMHGGTIDVTSEVGVGSTFTVRLPVT